MMGYGRAFYYSGQSPNTRASLCTVKCRNNIYSTCLMKGCKIINIYNTMMLLIIVGILYWLTTVVVLRSQLTVVR